MLIIALALLLIAAVVGAGLLLRRERHNDRQHRSLLEQLPETIVSVFDHDLRYQQILGATPGTSVAEMRKLIGRTVEEIVTGPEGQRLAGEYRRALAGESRAFAFTSTFSGLDYWIKVSPMIEHGEVVGGVAIAQNVNDLREAERELSAETRRRRVMLDAMNEAYVGTDDRGVVTEWNRAAELTFGYEAEEAIGCNVAELIIPERDRPDLRALLERRLPGQPAAGRHDLRAERAAIHRDGHEFPVELAGTLLEINGVTTYHSLMHDISGRKRAEQELRSHAADFEALSDAVAELARSTVAQEARMAICRAAARIAGAQVAILFEPDSSGTGLRTTAAEGTDLIGMLMPFTERSGAVAAYTSRENLFVGDIRGNPAVVRSIFHRTEAVSGFWVPIRNDGDENALGVIAVAWNEERDELSERLERVMGVISAEAAVAIERAALLDRLDRMTRTDDLTGLTNRRAWDLDLAREVARAERDEAPLAIAMVDLDRFKDYNDRHGHQAGDRLLKEAAGAWRGVLRETDLLARYGGEEFAVALPGCEPDAARSLVERLRAVTPGGGSCSAGLACWDGIETADDLLGRADAALYSAKQSGRDRTVVA